MLILYLYFNGFGNLFKRNTRKLMLGRGSCPLSCGCLRTRVCVRFFIALAAVRRHSCVRPIIMTTTSAAAAGHLFWRLIILSSCQNLGLFVIYLWINVSSGGGVVKERGIEPWKAKKEKTLYLNAPDHCEIINDAPNVYTLATLFRQDK